jgi:hypothetical protein
MRSAVGWILRAFSATFRFLKLTIQLNALVQKRCNSDNLTAFHVNICDLLIFNEYLSFMKQAWIHYLTSATLILKPIWIHYSIYLFFPVRLYTWRYVLFVQTHW